MMHNINFDFETIINNNKQLHLLNNHYFCDNEQSDSSVTMKKCNRFKIVKDSEKYYKLAVF